MSEKKANELFQKRKDGSLSSEEEAIFDNWYNKMAGDRKIELSPENLQESLGRVDSRLDIPGNGLTFHKKLVFQRFATAAVLLIAFGIGFYIYLNQSGSKQKLSSAYLPTKNSKIVLVLADGNQIAPENIPNKTVLSEPGAEITKNADGGLNYTVAKSSVNHSALNTLRTGRAGQYHFVLSDGTKVWLNSGSSLKYPVAFAGSERKVELTGEAYFEVAKKVHRPFKVITAQQDIEVLGTHFNVNSYANEREVKTTLFEGAIFVSSHNGKGMRLKAGQEAVFSGGVFRVSPLKGEQSIAWKNRMFHFENADVASIMKQLERWYDIRVVYTAKMPAIKFSGKVPMDAGLDQVLKILAAGGLQFKLSGRTIIIN